MELKVNTDQMREYGQELVKISDDTSKQIELLFTKIRHLVADGVWQGISANKFYEKIMPEEEMLIAFNNEFRKYGTNLMKCSENLDKIAKGYR